MDAMKTMHATLILASVLFPGLLLNPEASRAGQDQSDLAARMCQPGGRDQAADVHDQVADDHSPIYYLSYVLHRVEGAKEAYLQAVNGEGTPQIFVSAKTHSGMERSVKTTGAVTTTTMTAVRVCTGWAVAASLLARPGAQPHLSLDVASRWQLPGEADTAHVLSGMTHVERDIAAGTTLTLTNERHELPAGIASMDVTLTVPVTGPAVPK